MRRIPDVLLYAAYFMVVTGCLLTALVYASARSREAHVDRIVRAAESRLTVARDSVRTFQTSPKTHYRPAAGARAGASASAV